MAGPYEESLPLRTPSPTGTAEPSRLTTSFYPPAFVSKLNQTIRICSQENSSGALLLISINNLAMIINAYGNDTAEMVMLEIEQRLRDILLPQDHAQRISRDQFGFILAHCYAEDLQRYVVRINNILQHYGRDNFSSASLHVIGAIGSVSFPAQTKEALDAMDKAYVALNSQQGHLHHTFEATQKEADISRQQMGLASYLQKAIQEKRLRLAYQPVVSSKTGEIVHYEALLRVISPQGQISSAGPLIPVAERMGLIEVIDNLVMDMVVKELRASPKVSLAFNVSNVTTDNPQWMLRLSELLTETPEVASRLVVEITETAAHRDLRQAAYFVANVQSLGCQVALDDFGSGYTSFRQLKTLSVDHVKIDGAFIKDIAYKSDNRFFVKTLMDFAKGFGLKTVAEFVETGEIAKILLDMGVDFMQGYYFGKPDNHRKWLSEGEYAKE